MNTGEPMWNDKESEARRIERSYESSDVHTGSQISQRTRSQGKPDTGGRAGGDEAVKVAMTSPERASCPWSITREDEGT
jgi:hypothetical protein